MAMAAPAPALAPAQLRRCPCLAAPPPLAVLAVHRRQKVWHNYSFDSHVIENYGIKVAGYHADTMHLARLWDLSRRTDGGYSLEGQSHGCCPKGITKYWKEINENHLWQEKD